MTSETRLPKALWIPVCFLSRITCSRESQLPCYEGAHLQRDAHGTEVTPLAVRQQGTEASANSQLGETGRRYFFSPFETWRPSRRVQHLECRLTKDSETEPSAKLPWISDPHKLCDKKYILLSNTRFGDDLLEWTHKPTCKYKAISCFSATTVLLQKRRSVGRKFSYLLHPMVMNLDLVENAVVSCWMNYPSVSLCKQ